MREILEVGRYVRTKDGNIGKITEIIDDDIIVTDYEFDKEYPELKYTFDRCEALKSSPNIIDLIEVGDYVNGYKIELITNDPFISGQTNLWTNQDYYDNVFGTTSKIKIKDNNIKEILTHEQYENNCYRAERK